ncbi:MAG: hypothetical protein ACR2P4_03450 [Gammaproteobacteria bacterium]
MTVDNFGDNADKTAHPQNAGGGARAGDDAPVFVRNGKEFMRLYRRVRSPANAVGLFPFAASRAWWLFFGFAVLYALAFAVAGSLFPQSYQAWLDFCMPLAEYVGGLIPRAGNLTENLIAGGYPERADDALHAIAITNILMVPVFICMLVAYSSIVRRPRPPFVYVSCTRWTQIKIWLHVFFIVGMFWTAAAFFYNAYAAGDDKIGATDDPSIYGSAIRYHRGNMAMTMEVAAIWVMAMIVTMAPVSFERIRLARFTIVKQPPGDKS